MAQMVKSLPGVQDIQVQSLGWEDPLEKEMATHSSILGWKIPWTEGRAWWATVLGVTKKLDRTVRLNKNNEQQYEGSSEN